MRHFTAAAAAAAAAAAVAAAAALQIGTGRWARPLS